MRNSTSEKFDLAPVYFDNRYEVFSTIGRGRSSIVYRARRFTPGDTLDLSIPPIALKVILGIEKDPASAIRRIKREALALLSCKSPSVIRIFDYVAREDACYLTMEYAKYSDLGRLFEGGSSGLSTKAILKLVQGILEGVESIHKAGIIHRDLKPDNFLLTEDYQVKVGDFGVCLLKGERPSIHVVNQLVGTFDYTAPECLNGADFSFSSDLYSVGVSAFEMLCGELPALGYTVKEKIDSKTTGLIRDIPECLLSEYSALESFFYRALHPNSDKRFNYAEEMSEAISELIDKANSPKVKSLNRGNFTILDLFIENLLKEKSLRRIRRISILLSEKYNSFLSGIKKSLLFFKLSFLSMLLFVVVYLVVRVMQDNTSETISISPSMYSYELFMSEPVFGVLENLYSEDKTYRFAIVPSDEIGYAYFSLAKEGWEQVLISLDGFLQGEGVEVKGVGLNIILHPEKIEGRFVRGKFKNLITKQDGSWQVERK